MSRWLWLAAAAVITSACHDNTMAASLAPVPPVYRVPRDVEGATILLADEPTIESNDPENVARGKEAHVPQDFKVAMTSALRLAGFRVTSNPGDTHDLIAKLALNVSEDGDQVRQVYRCGLRAPESRGGTVVAQIDWAWPEGTFVRPEELMEFATHNLATEVVKSRAVLASLRRPKD